MVKTGAIFKNFIFDGVNSADYGVYITGAAVYNAPVRDVDFIEIPGRNGAFALDNGRFANITVTYPAGMYGVNETDFATAISDLRNALASRKGYCRLTDEYNPNEYRMAVYKSGLEVTPAQLKAGEFEITFDCKPQRFLFLGEEVITLGEWGQTVTYSGSIASFEGDETTAIKSLTAQIVPKQSGSGDPSPSNIRPISGWSEVTINRNGKNLCLVKYQGRTNNGVTYVLNSDGSISLSGTATGSSYFASNYGFNTSYMTYLPKGTYTISGSPNSNIRVYGSLWTLGGTFINNITQDSGSGSTFTTDEPVWFSPQIYVVSGANVSGIVLNLQVELGSTATAYEPYNGTTYPISLGQTVYGGTLDVVSGKLTIDMVTVDLGTLTWNKNTTYNIFTAWLTPTPAPSLADKSGYAVLPNYPYSPNFVLDSSKDKVCEMGRSGYFINNIIIRDTSYADATAFKTAMNGMIGAYKIATPTEIQLTPTEVNTLLGQNNIWADSGDVTVEIGQNPYILVNPTLFDARPLLKFNSTGTDGVINLGSQKITILSAYIGETPLKLSVQETTAAGYVFADVLTIQNTSTYKTGDAITFTGASVTLGYARGDGILTVELSNNNGISGTATHNGGNFSLNLSATESNFTAGTSATITKTISATVTPRVGTAETKTITFTATYNGSDTITTKWATQTFTGYPLSQNRTANTSNYSGVVNSTINSLANVDIYIDLDIGEAYSIDASNNVVSLNNFVNLGGELPILPPGATTITYGNSIQNLKITPRWWRV